MSESNDLFQEINEGSVYHKIINKSIQTVQYNLYIGWAKTNHSKFRTYVYMT